MGTAEKIRKFLSLDLASMLLLAEAYILMGWGRIQVSRSFAKVAPSLGESMEETTQDEIPADHRSLVLVHDAVEVMSRHTPWESKCLVRAIAAQIMLKRRRIASTLYLGTGRDEAGQLIAHAWLRSGPYFITGAEGREKFAVVGKFAKNPGR
ncbi:lasso peptide biosynthesis B2 protein [Paenibacillus sp. CC-CFT747]|nr:lasso peptide biosynthesis B2 protein [Paenibacillus sp. CC-CFT747]